MHKEDIKAAIRKRYGSLIAFEAVKGLPAGSVVDVLRGRSVAQARFAIADELGIAPKKLFQFKRSPRGSSASRDISKVGPPTHRLNKKVA